MKIGLQLHALQPTDTPSPQPFRFMALSERKRSVGKGMEMSLKGIRKRIPSPNQIFHERRRMHCLWMEKMI